MQNDVTPNAANAAPVPTPRSAPQASQTLFSDDAFLDTLFDERTEKIIRMSAWQLVRSGMFQPHEEDDIKQELRIKLWQQMSKFNLELSSRHTYATLICCRTSANIFKSRARALSIKGTVVSFDEKIDDDGCSLGDSLSCEEYRIVIGRQSLTDEQMQMLKNEVAVFLAQLPEEDRSICRQIMEGHSLRHIARTLDCPFTTLLSRFHQHIAPKFPRRTEAM